MHDPMYEALVPNVVIPVRAAKSHRTSSDGYPGDPSYSSTVASVSSPETMKFHIIHPVVVNQNSRSPACASTCRCSIFRCSSRMPPWDWTIAFGSPVVPDEYRTHSGCSNGTRSNSSGSSALVSDSQLSSPRTAVCTPGIESTIASSADERSNWRPLYW